MFDNNCEMNGYINHILFLLKQFQTRTTRMPAFWGYPAAPWLPILLTRSYWIPSQNQFYCEVMANLWPWRYRSRSKGITCHTPSDASDHLWQIWKESIEDCRRFRADTIFKVKAERPWKYRSRSKVITCDTPSDANDDLCQIWKECKQNCRFFSRWKPKNLRKIEILEFCYKLNMRHTL